MWAQILSRIIEFLFGTAGAGVILWLALPRLVNNLIDHQFSKKLEDHKHQLQQITLAETHNYQRLIRDFDLFTTKRHEIYPELFKSILIADGHVRNLRGGTYSLTFEGFNDKDIRQYLEEKNVPSGMADIFVESWKHGGAVRKDTVASIKKYIGRLDIQKARMVIDDAKRYYYLSAIYISDDVSKDVDEALRLIDEFWLNVECPEGSKYFEVDHNNSIEGALSKIKEAMRQEVGIGDYAEAE
jgi:hypothetical protein